MFNSAIWSQIKSSKQNFQTFIALKTIAYGLKIWAFIPLYRLHSNNLTVPPHILHTLHSNAIYTTGREPWLNKCLYKQHSHILLSPVSVTQKAYIRTWCSQMDQHRTFWARFKVLSVVLSHVKLSIQERQERIRCKTFRAIRTTIALLLAPMSSMIF